MKRWNSLYIYYISGTGNARASSYWIADEARKLGLITRVIQIDRLKDIQWPSAEERPLIGFVFPTHGFNAPPIMLRFIAGFPKGLCNEVFLLNTRAGMKMGKLFMPGLSGVALMLPSFMLRVKGYKSIGLKSIDLPSNWISLHPGIKQTVIESIFQRCEKIARQFATTILEGNKVFSGLLSLPVDLAISPIALGYYIGGRFFLSKTYIANNKCNNCGLCIKECPTESIKMVNGRPFWMLTCESCMRCMNNCPHRAIEAAHGMAVVFWLAYAALSTSVLMFLTKLFNITSIVWWWWIFTNIVGIALMVVTATILYRIFHFIMGWKPVEFVVRITSLTSYKFWRRYKRNKKTVHA
jgi:Pyruvate/2-oxoacid:ferredoxin oxidoreductase delta subunit